MRATAHGITHTLLLTLSLLILTAMATASAAVTDLARQRQLFGQAMADAHNGRLQQDDPRLGALRDYPLYEYVIAADLRHRIKAHPSTQLDQRIAAFMAQHPDLPPAQRLRDPWLESLGQRERWQLVISHTKPADDAADQCRAVHARIALGQQPRTAALALWRVGRSQPDTCNLVFDWLQAQGLLTPDEILHRARLSLLAGHYGMVRYLAGKLPANLAAVTEQ